MWCGCLIKARSIDGSSLHQYDKDHLCMSLVMGKAVASNALKSLATESGMWKHNRGSALDGSASVPLLLVGRSICWHEQSEVVFLSVLYSLFVCLFWTCFRVTLQHLAA